jgi:hypothetical protein
MKQQFDIPILFIVFNGPDTTEKVFERIREIRPAKLFVAADGPRPSKEGEKENRSVCVFQQRELDLFEEYNATD